MAKVLIFGGTTEGRRLAECCASLQIEACVCVVSDYGEQLLPETKMIKVLVGALDQPGIEQLLAREQPALVMDATHPYAEQVTKHVARACQNEGREYLRVLRGESCEEMTAQEIRVDSVEAAIDVLAGDESPVLVTTGSKELIKYRKLANCQERIYARVLASHDGIAACEAAGIKGSHIIAMQGPFSRELNAAMLRQIKAGWLVTKESGRQGGFPEKLEACRDLNVRAVIIGRPRKETGLSLTEACRRLANGLVL